MLKTFSVLFVLGLALGLWIGFNPQTHDKAVQAWTEAPTWFATAKLNMSDAMHNWSLSLKTSEQAGGQKIMVVWKQASSIFPAIWDNVHRIWLEITTRLHIVKK